LLDIRLADCTDARFDGRYMGTLIENPVFKYASLRLSPVVKQKFDVPSVSAVLRRPAAIPSSAAQQSGDAGAPQ
jgi:hypothetical protein